MYQSQLPHSSRRDIRYYLSACVISFDKESKMLSAQEVTKHNNRESCWVIVQEQVYDVTDFLDEHPGGAEIVLRYAGKVSDEHWT